MSDAPVRPSELLTGDESELLRRALGEWGGPAHASPEMAVAMGFADVADLLVQVRRLRGAFKDDQPIDPVDWARALLATEIVFVSDLVGTGFEWSTTTGRSDEETIRELRGIQRKLGRVIRPFYRTRPAP